jgi:hypothetical protein
MRNPIQATPDRPFPLPDCILQDAWWLTEPPRTPPPQAERRREFHLVEGRTEEGQIDRYRQQDD